MTSKLAKDLVKIVINHRGRRRELLRSYFFDLASLMTPSLSVDTQFGRFHVSTHDKEIAKTLFARRIYYDQIALGTVVDYLRGRDPGADLVGKTFLDIGANLGTTTIAAVNGFGVSLAIAAEPAQDNFRLLEKNIEANGLGDRIRPLQVAVSDREATLELNLSDRNWGDHRIVGGGDPRNTLRVRSTTVDALVEAQQIDPKRVGLLWIDTQGHEPSVLAGARGLLSSHEIPVVAEYGPLWLKLSGGIERFERIVQNHFSTWIDLSTRDAIGSLAERPVDDIQELRSTYREKFAFTDLLLLQ